MEPHKNLEPADLLEREDPETTYPSDVRHWIAIYRARIGLYRDLLDRTRLVLSRAPAGRQSERLAAETGLLEDQLARYQRRLEFWYARQWKLEGLHLDAETRTVTYRERSVHLTVREFQLLETLAHRSPATMRGPQLLVEAWRDSRLPEETLRTYIVRLRLKLAELEAGVEVVNRPRHGYALIFPSQAVSTA